MDITKNHIGTGNYFWKSVATRMNSQFSHGTLSEFDFKAITVFPLLHIAIRDIQVNGQTALITYSVMIADQNMRYTNDLQGYTNTDLFAQYGYTENVNYSFVLQELYIRIVKEIRYMEEQLYNTLQISRPFTMTPFVQDLDAVLTGFTTDITMEIVNPIVTDGWC